MDSLLPALSTLIKAREGARGTSYVEADLIKAGEDFDPLLPNNRVSPGVGVAFDPAWSDNSDSAELLAYCMYAFMIPDYDRNSQVRYTWSTPPPTITEAWIGLANWGTDRWEWYRCKLSGINDLPSIDPYIAFGGGVLMCVVVYGVDNSTLSEVRIGTQLPQPELTPNTWRGFVPLTVNLNAAASIDPDGSIMRYEFDADGDGTFEMDTGATPTLEHEYAVAGTYFPAVRVTDNDGITAVASSEIGAAAEFVHTWGAAGDDTVADTTVDSAGSFYQVGDTYSVGAGNAALITKYDAAGQPVWSAAWDGPGWDSYTGIAIGSAGEVYVCGSTTSFGAGNYDGLLQRWSSSGELVWSKVWGGGAEDYFEDIAMSGSRIFVVGRTLSFGNQMQALFARFNTTGDLLWDKQFGGADMDGANAITRNQPLLGNPVLHVVGYTQTNPPFDFDLLYYTFNEQGTYLSRKQYGDDGMQQGFAITAPSFFGGETIIVGTTSTGGLSNDLLVLNASGAWAKRWDWGSKDEFHDIVRLPDGNYMLAGKTNLPIESWADAVLISITGEGAVAGFEMRDWKGQDDSAIALASYPGGVLIGGAAVNNSAEWSPGILVLNNQSGSWANIFWGLSDPAATVSDANGDVLEVPAVVLDSGGGGSDFLIELREL